MRRYFSLGIIVLCCMFISNINFGDAYCSDYLLNSYKQDLNKCKNYGYCILWSESELQQKVNKEQKEYDRCVNYDKWMEKYYKARDEQDYAYAITCLEQAKKYAIDILKDSISTTIMQMSNNVGNAYAVKGDYSNAIKYYQKTYQTPQTLFNIGMCYFNLGDFSTALSYYKKAKEKSLDASLDNDLKYRIAIAEKAKEYENLKKTWKTNDKYGFLQYYLRGINIFDARDKLPNNKKNLVIAVIDDGVNLNHPDLKDKLWINKKEIDGDGIDNDKNGYVDDYNGWDFTLNMKPTLPSDSHGTMVAGIIAANTDNIIGIAGIVPNVQIMSLKVFGFDSNGAKEEDIIKAVNYAIDNGANIINLSIEGSQFVYTNAYDSVFKKAYEKGIVIVVAAGNGDLLSSYSEGVNTSVNKKSPVCNESNSKVVIGVGALTKNGTQAKWSNYGSCVDFYMYGEEIYSTAITLDGEPYLRADGTSFSAPIVAGIIGLGYDKFGKVKPDIVYDNLKKSLSGNVIDAAKYLDNLSASIGELKNAIYWLGSKGFTKAKNVDDFKYSNGITRAEAAKFFVIYAKLFKKDKRVNSDDKCKFSDLGKAPVDLRSYMINACRYGLLGGSKGKFMPNSKLTNAQAVTVFMRMYGGKKDENGNHYADRYFIDAYKLGLIDGMVMGKQKNYEKGATRGDMAILLYRGSKLMKK